MADKRSLLSKIGRGARAFALDRTVEDIDREIALSKLAELQERAARGAVQEKEDLRAFLKENARVLGDAARGVRGGLARVAGGVRGEAGPGDRSNVGLSGEGLRGTEVSPVLERAGAPAGEAFARRPQPGAVGPTPADLERGLSSVEATAQLAVRFPEAFEKFNKGAGLISARQKSEAADFGFRLENTPFDQRDPVIRKRITKLDSQRRDSSDTRSLLGMDEESQNQAARVSQVAGLTNKERVAIAERVPSTRTIIEGEQTVSQEFNPKTGRFEEVGRGPRGVLQRIETGPPGSFSKTGQQRGKQIVEAENSAAATVQAIETAGDLVNLVRSNESIIGKPGAFFRITNDLAQTAKGIARGFGVDITDAQFARQTDPGNFDFSQFRGTAIESEVLRSGITSLAYAAATAAGQTGRSVSDKDIQRFINQIAGSTADPIAFERVIQSFTNRMARNFTIGMQARRIDRPDLTQMVLDSLDTVADEALREAQGIDGFDKLTPEEQKELIDVLRQRRR